MASPTRSSRRWRRLAAVILVACIAASTASGSSGREAFRACLVIGPQLPGDLTSAPLAADGLRAASRPGVVVRLVASPSPEGYERSLRSCVQWGAGITIGVGFSIAPALDTVAAAFPSKRFAAVGVDVASLAHRPANVVGVLFRDEQAGYLAGYAAGLWAKARQGKAVGSVGGLKIPPVDRFIAGFQFGATRADRAVQTLNAYADGFSGTAKCRQRALEQIARGSVVEFAVAGGCGAGAVAAAGQHGVYAIDTAEHLTRRTGDRWLMTTAVDRADVAVRSVIGSAVAGPTPPGANVILGAAQGGVGYGAWSPTVPVSIRSAVARQLRLLKTGRIAGIPTSPD
jgi:basic membrane protein A